MYQLPWTPPSPRPRTSFQSCPGFEVETITDADADVSFAYACCAKHFIPGGGGFSKLMAKVVRYKGNDVYYVKI